jgi:predicted phage terminase large subunit-like protein
MARPKKNTAPRKPRAPRVDPLEREANRLGVTITEMVDAKAGMPEAPEPEPIPFADAPPLPPVPPIAVVAPERFTPRRPGKHADSYEPRADLVGVDIGAFFALVSPGCVEPRHLAPILDAIRRIARGEVLRIVFSAPRQHGKSTAIHHACAWLHLLAPWLSIQYATYEQTFSEHNARNIRRIELSSGVRISGEHNTIKGWTINHELPGRAPGKFLATSIDGRANGYGANLLVIDDPFKNTEDAFAARTRDAVHDTFRYVFLPCLAPGASVIVVASRWHDDDLSGRLVRDGWLHIRLPAICDDAADLLGRAIGEPLCPWGPDPREPRDLAFLENLRFGERGADGVRRGGMGEHAWHALMQGVPLPPDAGLFKGERYYSGGPPPFVAEIIGCDLAYSQSRKADFAVLSHLGLGADGVVYVTDVWRDKLDATQWIAQAKTWAARFPRAKFFFYSEGPEKYLVPQWHAQSGIMIQPIPTRGLSKAIRANKIASAWNAGNVRLPADAPWVAAALKEIQCFTGSGDDHDDVVDALTAGFDMLVGSATTAPTTGWGARTGF